MAELTLRWGDDAPEDADEARARLLDAAESCFERDGIMTTTVENIAVTAQVSRATVYRYFSGRDDIILGVILRDTDRYLARIRPRIERQPSLADALVEFVEVTLRAATRDPHLSLLFSVEEARAAGGMIAGRSAALFERITGFLRPVFERWAEQTPQDLDVADAAEWVLRTILSLLTIDGPRRRSPDARRAFLERFLVPPLVSDPGRTSRRARR